MSRVLRSARAGGLRSRSGPRVRESNPASLSWMGSRMWRPSHGGRASRPPYGTPDRCFSGWPPGRALQEWALAGSCGRHSRDRGHLALVRGRDALDPGEPERSGWPTKWPGPPSRGAKTGVRSRCPGRTAQRRRAPCSGKVGLSYCRHAQVQHRRPRRRGGPLLNPAAGTGRSPRGPGACPISPISAVS